MINQVEYLRPVRDAGVHRAEQSKARRKVMHDFIVLLQIDMAGQKPAMSIFGAKNRSRGFPNRMGGTDRQSCSPGTLPRHPGTLLAGIQPHSRIRFQREWNSFVN